MIPGLDISKWQQGPVGIDWPTCAKYFTGLHPEAFVIIEWSDGLGNVNPFFVEQVEGAQAAGFKNVGVYILLRPSRGTGAQHADFVLQAFQKIGGIKKNMFVAGDFEDTDIPATADLDAFALDFDGRLTRPLGFAPLFYSGSWYTDPHNLNRDPKLADMGLWWCYPSANGVIPVTPEPWRSAGKNIIVLQNNWSGQVPGIQGNVDLDIMPGDISTLRPFQYGYQVDPVAGKPAIGTPDLPKGADLRTVIKHSISLLEEVPPGAEVAAANLAQYYVENYGLLGA